MNDGPQKSCRHCGRTLHRGMFADIYQFRRSRFCGRACYLAFHASEVELKTCPQCGGAWIARGKVAIAKRFCSTACQYLASRKNGAKYVMTTGYVIVKQHGHPNASENGYVYEHRLTAEERLGRYLVGDEVVHHINGDKADNRPENLAVMPESEHLRLHMANRMAHRHRKDIHQLEVAS